MFRYLDYEVDGSAGELRCRYALDEHRFEERIAVAGATAEMWDDPAVREAARLVHLLAGVSYYKAGAPPVVDLGDTPIRPGEPEFLADYFLHGLGEFAFRNGLTLDLAFTGGAISGPPVPFSPAPARPLVPFGGGIDSIVTVESVRRLAPDLSLFVVSRAGDRFAALEDAAAVAGLPVLRAERALDPAILRSTERGFLNGHVPVTAIISAVAVLAAVLDGRDAVVMSNERSASVGNVEVDGRSVNHQYSKSAAYEDWFRRVLGQAFEHPPDYFSLLREHSELSVARRFAELRDYHHVFRSCNRAFHIDPAQRLATWCGRCDKCAFVDLVLAPFLPAAELDTIFDGREPLADPELGDRFRTLLGLSAEAKPFECVGDVDESRTAAVLAFDRPDRRDSVVLASLVHELGPRAADAAAAAAPGLLRLDGPGNVPEAYAAARLLV